MGRVLLGMVDRHRESPVQVAILEYLRDYKADPDNEGNSPTYQEIADTVSKYPADIYKHILTMERKALVKLSKKGKINLGGRYVPPE